MPYPLGHEGDWRKRETKKRNQPCFFQHCLEWFIFTSLHVEANMLTSPAPLFFLRPKVRNARVRSPSLRPRGICFCLKNAKLISAESGEIGQWQPTTWKCEEEKRMCAARESNPGRKNGNLAWYHYTSDAMAFHQISAENHKPLKLVWFSLALDHVWRRHRSS